VAAIQWLVILERVWACIWEWYKFYGYDGDRGITVGVGTQILFYLLSSGFASAGLLMSRIPPDTLKLKFQRKLNRFSAISLLSGMTLWTLILISPLVTFR
jgi:hypothetical protein